MSQPIIKVDKLKVIYNQGKSNEVRSLDDVSLEIFPEEYVIIFGPSGCGKSTLLYAMSGLQSPTEGEVELSGMKLSGMNKKERVKLHQSGAGMIFQAFYLIPSLTILDNVCLPKVFVGESRKERMEAGENLLARFGIGEQAHKFPSQLSGGQKQRVSIARSLVNNPDIIFADEPVGNLDSESAENVLNILKELNEVDKKTIILVTHNPEHLGFADRVIYMRDGKMVKEEVNREKRPKEAVRKEQSEMEQGMNVSSELRMLMRTFSNLSPEQIGALLMPYKADQLLSHVLSELTEEQIDSAGEFLKQWLLGNLDKTSFTDKLNDDMKEGGAGWNKTRAESFADRVDGIFKQAEILKLKGPDLAAEVIGKYLQKLFSLKLDQEKFDLLVSFLKLRIADEIDRTELRSKLDNPFKKGGLGLYKNTAEKVSREMEIIKFINYQS